MSSFRVAAEADLDDIANLELRAGELFRTVGLDWVAELPSSPGDLAELLSQGKVWLYEDAGKLLGWAGVDWRGDDAHLRELDVDPAHGRQGHGTRILRYVEEQARIRDCRYVGLTTFRDVPWNGPWYAREGYNVVPLERLPRWLVDVRFEERASRLDRAPRVAMLKQLRSGR